jgi:hypothetical protein
VQRALEAVPELLRAGAQKAMNRLHNDSRDEPLA